MRAEPLLDARMRDALPVEAWAFGPPTNVRTFVDAGPYGATAATVPATARHSGQTIALITTPPTTTEHEHKGRASRRRKQKQIVGLVLV